MKAIASAALALATGTYGALSNTQEWNGAVLYDEDGVEVGRLTGQTAWEEIGYAHAKQYQLSLVTTVTLAKDLKPSESIFWFLSWPKKSSNII